MFLSAGMDVKVHLIEDHGVDTGTIFTPAPEKEILQLSLSKDNFLIAFLQEGGYPKIFSIQEGRVVETLQVPNVICIAFAHNIKGSLALSTKNGETMIYDTLMEVMMKVLPQSSSPVTQLEFTSDNQQLCGISEDFLIIFTDEACVKRIKQRQVCTVVKCNSRIPNQVLVGYENGGLALFSTTTFEELFNLDVTNTTLTNILITDEGYYLLQSDNKIDICVVRSKTNFFTTVYLKERCSITSTAMSADCKFLAIGLSCGLVKLYDATNLQLIEEVEAHHNTEVKKIIFRHEPVEEGSTKTEEVKSPLLVNNKIENKEFWIVERPNLCVVTDYE